MTRRLVTMAVLCAISLFSSVSRAVPVTQIEFLGKHPDAVQQPTAIGQTLHTLHAAGGEIYIGYGDFFINTGPINMRYFDPQSDTFSPILISTNTEAIHRIKVIGNEVWATTADPLLFSDGGYIKGPTGGGTWSAVNSLASLHLFDLATYQGNPDHVFLAGSGGPTAIGNSIVYESQDGGDNWNLVLDLPTPANSPGFTRFYGIGELADKLYVQHSLLGQGIAPLAMYNYDGTSWTQQASPTTPGGQSILFIDPDTFAGKVVVRNEHSGLDAEPTYLFDGTSLTEIQVAGNNGQLSYWDQYVDGNTLYLLTNEMTVIATQDLVNYEVVVAGLPATVRSLAVTGSSFYFGASDSSLYRTAVPEPSALGLVLISLLAVVMSKPACMMRLWRSAAALILT